MKIWVSGTVKEVIEISKTGLIEAVVTNPTVTSEWAESGQSLEELAKYVVEETGLPLYIQLKGPKFDDFRRECDYLKQISEKIIPKIPSTLDGISAAGLLEKQGIETLVTTVCSINQAYACAAVGISTICPYYNRIKDNGVDADALFTSIISMYKNNKVDTKIIPSSIRSAHDVAVALKNGCNGVIIFKKVFDELFENDVTNQSLQEFEKDWNNIIYHFH